MQITRLRQFWAVPTATQRLLVQGLGVARPSRGRYFPHQRRPTLPRQQSPISSCGPYRSRPMPAPGVPHRGIKESALCGLWLTSKAWARRPRCLPRVRGHAASRLARTTSVVSTLALCRLFARDRCNTARGPRLRQRTATSGAPGQQASRRWPLPTPGSAPTSPRTG